MNNESIDEQKRSQLLQEGYCIIENVLDKRMVDRLTLATEELLRHQTQEDTKQNYSTGSMIPVIQDPFFVSLITWPRALRALAQLGYKNPKFSSGYIISKAPSSPPLLWHCDYSAWDDPDAFGPPQQLFLMYYLVNTSRENGCLRVIPGSHLQDNPLHALLKENAHRQEQPADLLDPAYSVRPDEMDITVKAGDLVIGDARLLHAAHSNNSDQRRTVITLWYHPDMASLHESVQAFIAQMTMNAPDNWSDEVKAAYEPLLARYDGQVSPLNWNRHRPSRNSYPPA